MRAKDVMTTSVITVQPDTEVREIARILLFHRISGVPVVGENGRVVGMVTEGDLVRRVESGTEHRQSGWMSYLAGAEFQAEAFVKSRGLRARDVMTRDVVVADQDTSLRDIASLLERRRIKRVPIVSEGKLAGIVSRANLLQGLVAWQPAQSMIKSDESVRAAIMDSLQRIEGGTQFLNVIVSNGVAYLWGAVNSDTERNAARVAAETTPGVNKVEDNLFVLPPRVKAALGSE